MGHAFNMMTHALRTTLEDLDRAHTRLEAVLAGLEDGVVLTDIGVGESDLSWQVFATIAWRFNDWGAVVGGYRYLSLDYETADYKADLSLQGPAIGLSIRF